MSNNKIEYAEKDILIDEDFLDENVKIRVNMWMDMDIVKAAQAEAVRRNPSKQGRGYQTVLNEKLREAFFSISHAPHDVDVTTFFLQGHLETNPAFLGTLVRALENVKHMKVNRKTGEYEFVDSPKAHRVVGHVSASARKATSVGGSSRRNSKEKRKAG